MALWSLREDTELGPHASLQERESALRLGMFIFLGSETLLFAGLFALYAGYRAQYPEVFARAVGYDEEWIGSVNTMVLLVSSFLVAWADRALRRHESLLARLCIAGACSLGLAFLGLKGLEYYDHWQKGIRPGAGYAFSALREPGAALFFNLYYLMTGLHALHVTGGLIALTCIGIGIQRQPHAPKYEIRLELGALYWHLVDIVWIFLWPLLYLIR